MVGKSRARIAHRKSTRLKRRGFPGSFSCVQAGSCKRRASAVASSKASFFWQPRHGGGLRGGGVWVGPLSVRESVKEDGFQIGKETNDKFQ